MNRNQAFQALTEYRYANGTEALLQKQDTGFVIAQAKSIGKWDGAGNYGRAFTLTWTGTDEQGTDQFELEVEPDAQPAAA